MSTLINITEDEFDATYSLLPNHLNPNASWATGDGPGCLFETYGDELDFVRRQDPRTVWTLLDGDDGNQFHQLGEVVIVADIQRILDAVAVAAATFDGKAEH